MRRHKPTTRWPVSRQRGAGPKRTSRPNFFASLADISDLGPRDPEDGVDLSVFSQALDNADDWEKTLAPCSEEEVISYLFGPEAVHSSLSQTIARRRNDPRVTVVTGPKTKQ